MADDPPKNPERSGADGGGRDGEPRRPFNWDAVTAIAALVVGVIAVLIAAYTAWSTHQQTYAHVWPHVDVGAHGTVAAFMVGNGISVGDGGSLVAVNSGVGPAIVRRAEVLVNGKPEPNWDHVFKALGYPELGNPPHTATSALSGEVFSPGQKVWLITTAGSKEWLRLRHKLYREVVIRTCYCSTLGDCWIDTWKHSLPSVNRTQSVGSCAKIPKKDEFLD